MTDHSRRDALILGLAATAASTLPTRAEAASSRRARRVPGPSTQWATGIEGQRKADLGNGFYLNPVLAGDHPDPSILKDGDAYYKVSSSFHYCPGLVIWQSRDLVNWSPVGPALNKPVGSVFAPDLVKHDGRYFIYFPAFNLPKPGATSAPLPVVAILVVWADHIAGPWSDPIDVNIHGGIDPGHVVGEDGKRYLFIDSGRLIPISDDGLTRAGKTEKVYGGWTYPEDWVVEGFSLEGPKILRRNDWYYLFSAEGGTAGPPTSHMVVVARSRSVRGPWENCPHNPIVRTASIDEPWWSRGHATPIQGPTGDWWLVYHGYENGFRTLGRQMLLEPFAWTTDDWPKARGGDLSAPMSKPLGGKTSTHGIAFSGDFSASRLGTALAFFQPEEDYRKRIRFENGTMILTAQGDGPGNSAPLLINAGDRNYEMSVQLELVSGAQGGILLFYDARFFCGLGSDGDHLRTYKMGAEPLYGPPRAASTTRLFLRLANRENVVTFYTSADGETWKTSVSFEVAGYNHNVADGFLSLRPALYATKSGSVIFSKLRYSAMA